MLKSINRKVKKAQEGAVLEEIPAEPDIVEEEQDPEMLFIDKYNTPLTNIEMVEFNKWARLESEKQGRDIMMDKGAYDIQGFWKYDQQVDGDGHGSDKWKKPNHPKFSNESIYNGVDGYEGGEWDGDGFRPAKQTLEWYGVDGLMMRFNAEPNRPEFLDMSKKGTKKFQRGSKIIKAQKGGRVPGEDLMTDFYGGPLEEVNISSRSSTKYPNYHLLSIDERKHLHDKGPIGRGIRRKAGEAGNRGMAEDVTRTIKGMGEVMGKSALAGAAIGTGVGAAPYIASAAAPYVAALQAPSAILPGMSNAGVLGGALNSYFAGDAITNRIPKAARSTYEGNYKDAAGDFAWAGLDLVGAGVGANILKNTFSKALPYVTAASNRAKKVSNYVESGVGDAFRSFSDDVSQQIPTHKGYYDKAIADKVNQKVLGLPPSSINNSVTRVQTMDNLYVKDGQVYRSTKPYEFDPINSPGEMASRNTVHWSQQPMTESAGGNWGHTDVGFISPVDDVLKSGRPISIEPSDTFVYNAGDVPISKNTRVVTTNPGARDMFKNSGYSVDFVDGGNREMMGRLGEINKPTMLTTDGFKNLNTKMKDELVFPATQFDTSSKYHNNSVLSRLENSVSPSINDEMIEFINKYKKEGQSLSDFTTSVRGGVQTGEIPYSHASELFSYGDDVVKGEMDKLFRFDGSENLQNLYESSFRRGSGIDLTRTRGSAQRSGPRFTTNTLDNGMVSKTPVNPESSHNTVNKITVPGTEGYVELLKNTNAGPNHYYLSANMENPMAAGRALKYLESTIPKGGTILEKNSLSTDSFYSLLKRLKDKNFSSSVHGHVPMNNSGVYRKLGNSNKTLEYPQSLDFTDFREAKKAVEEINTRIAPYGLPKATMSKRRIPYIDASGVERSKMGFGVDVPNIGLTKLYQLGGLLNND